MVLLHEYGRHRKSASHLELLLFQYEMSLKADFDSNTR
jgi:hypothetical protein